MTVIKQDDLIQSVADALQFISYYHPVDFIQAMHEAYLKEESPAARDSMAQILINSRMCAIGHRPICQDTGIVTVFVRVGMDVRWDGATMSVDDMINEGVRRAYNLPENVLRASILADPAGARKNTKDNTPAVIHYSIVPGDKVEVDVAAKGGGSENKSKMAMLNPSDSIVDWVLKTVPEMGAGWCPPGMLGIGIGGTAEKAAVMAKEVLMESIDIHELKARGPQNKIEEMRLELFEKVNQLGIGAQGLGGLTTVLDVKIMDYPTHAASLPVCMIPNCAATRHAHFVLDGTGPAELTPPPLESAIGQVSTLTVGGEVSFGYVGPRRRVDLRLARGYEPDPYAGALTLWDRLGGDFLYRPLWELALYGSLQLMHGAQTSPARVSQPADGPLLQVVSPQNRTIYMLLSNVGVGFNVWGPVSAFAEGNLFAMAIRGEPVPEYPALGREFPTEVARFPFDPSLSTQNSTRFVLYLGLRAQLDTMKQSRREIELLREARSLP